MQRHELLALVSPSESGDQPEPKAETERAKALLEKLVNDVESRKMTALEAVSLVWKMNYDGDLAKEERIHCLRVLSKFDSSLVDDKGKTIKMSEIAAKALPH